MVNNGPYGGVLEVSQQSWPLVESRAAADGRAANLFGSSPGIGIRAGKHGRPACSSLGPARPRNQLIGGEWGGQGGSRERAWRERGVCGGDWPRPSISHVNSVRCTHQIHKCIFGYISVPGVYTHFPFPDLQQHSYREPSTSLELI